MLEKIRKIGENLGVIKKEKEPLMPMFYAYVHRGALRLSQLLEKVDPKDVPEFIRLTDGLRRMIDDNKLEGGAYFRANQLINLVEKGNLEAEVMRAKGEHFVGSTE